MFSLLIIPAIIQPKWLIEENANNFRREVWLIPPILPNNIEEIIMKIIKSTLIV